MERRPGRTSSNWDALGSRRKFQTFCTDFDIVRKSSVFRAHISTAAFFGRALLRHPIPLFILYPIGESRESWAAREVRRLQYLADRSEKAPLFRISPHGSSLLKSLPNGFLFRWPAAETSRWSKQIDFLELHCNSVCRLFSEVICKPFSIGCQ